MLAPQLREARRSTIGSRPGGAAEEESERRRRTERREGRRSTRSASGSSPGVAAEEADGEEGRARATEVATMARRADGGRGGEASIGDGEGMSVVPGGGAGSAGAWEMSRITPGSRSAASIDGSGICWRRRVRRAGTRRAWFHGRNKRCPVMARRNWRRFGAGTAGG